MAYFARSQAHDKAITGAVCVGWLAYKSPEVLSGMFDRKNQLIWVRGFNMTIALLACYTALEYTSLSTTITIFQTRPFFVIFFCFIILGERFTIIQVLSCGQSSNHSASPQAEDSGIVRRRDPRRSTRLDLPFRGPQRRCRHDQAWHAGLVLART